MSADVKQALPAMWARIWNEPAIVADADAQMHPLQEATAMRARVHSDTLK
ncbi:hypothetical protein [Lysobacter capsici]